MPRFVILRHECPAGFVRPSHWDLMLEQQGVLRTWALDGEPDGPTPIAAEQLGDHRIAYLEYEGRLSDDRGSVTQWDAGEYRILEETPLRLVAELSGQRIRGEIVLACDDADDRRWEFLRRV